MTRFLALVDVLNYVFHVYFTEGWKCDLFASPHCVSIELTW